MATLVNYTCKSFIKLTPGYYNGMIGFLTGYHYNLTMAINWHCINTYDVILSNTSISKVQTLIL